MQRSEIWWANLPEPQATEPGYRRPVLVVQADAYNRSEIATVIVATITSNLRLGLAPGNVHLSRKQSGLPRDSVINVSQLLTIDRTFLVEIAGRVPPGKMREVAVGLARVLDLDHERDS